MPQNPPSATTPAEQHAEGVPERILVVEDDKVIRALVTTTLESRGISFLTAATGREALAEASRANPDVILLDISMPVMTGDEALAEIRSKDWGADIPVLVLTNLGQEEAPKSLKQLGVSSFIVKAELTPRQVVDRVKKTLNLT